MTSNLISDYGFGHDPNTDDIDRENQIHWEATFDDQGNWECVGCNVWGKEEDMAYVIQNGFFYKICKNCEEMK